MSHGFTLSCSTPGFGRHFRRRQDMRGLGFVAAFVLAAGLAGCQSTHEEGVKSNLRTQWTDVSADTKTTTEAARAVLEEDGLKEVRADATNVDGKATAKMADGTKV